MLFHDIASLALYFKLKWKKKLNAKIYNIRQALSRVRVIKQKGVVLMSLGFCRPVIWKHAAYLCVTTHCWLNAAPTSVTLAHNQDIIEPAFRINQDEAISITAVKARRWSNVDLMFGHRLRRWPNIKPTLSQRLLFAEMIQFPITPTNWRRWADIDLMLVHRLRRWPSIKPALVQCLWHLSDPLSVDLLCGICFQASYIWRRVLLQPSKHDNSGQHWLDAGSLSTTLAKHQASIGSTTCVYWTTDDIYFHTWICIYFVKNWYNRQCF